MTTTLETDFQEAMANLEAKKPELAALDRIMEATAEQLALAKGIVNGLADRVAAQSQLLSRLAERDRERERLAAELAESRATEARLVAVLKELHHEGNLAWWQLKPYAASPFPLLAAVTAAGEMLAKYQRPKPQTEGE